jgi:hypothetical protein
MSYKEMGLAGHGDLMIYLRKAQPLGQKATLIT